MKKSRKTALIVAGLIGAVGVFAASQVVKRWGRQSIQISRETTAILSPVRADGTIDYLRALNEKYSNGITPEDNGYVTWLQIEGSKYNSYGPLGNDASRIPMLKMCKGDIWSLGNDVWESPKDFLERRRPIEHDFTLASANTELQLAGSELWLENQHPFIAEYIKEVNSSLAKAIKAAHQPSWWTPYFSGNDRNIGLLIGSNLSSEVGYVLCARATLFAKQNKFNDFLNDAIAAKLLARHIAGGATLQEWAEGIKIERQANQAIGVIVGTGTLTIEECEKILNALNKLHPMPNMLERIDIYQRWNSLDQIIELASPGSWISSISEFQFFDKSAVDWNRVLSEINNYYDKLILAIKKDSLDEMKIALNELNDKMNHERSDLTETPFAKKSGESRDSYSKRMNWIIPTFVVAKNSVGNTLERQENLDNCMLKTLIAVAKIKAETGFFPKTLEMLVPKYINNVPKDIFSRQSADFVKYKFSNENARIYSIGPNQRDDDGQFDPNKNGEDDIQVGNGGSIHNVTPLRMKDDLPASYHIQGIAN